VKPEVKTLIRYREPLVMATMPPGTARPEWAVGGVFVAGIETSRETSIVCTAQSIPVDVPTYGPYTAYEVGTHLDPSQPGLLSELAAGPARVGISLMPFATYDRGWVLVQRADAATVEKVWRQAGFTIHDQEESA
jgi:hypothetical protein